MTTSGRPGPTFRSEFRRGFNPYNLTVGAVSALVLAIVVAVATQQGFLPDLSGGGTLKQSVCTGVGLFILITLIHVAAHAYFGWRFEVGLAAYREGQWTRAGHMLAPVMRPGMDHYDIDGVARDAWQDASGRRQ